MSGGVSIGQSFGKLGTVVENPDITISGFTKHGLNQSITREVSPQTLLNTIRNPSVVLQQSGGKYLYLTKQAGVVLTSNGKLITTYPASMFDEGVLNILKGIR